MMYDLSRTERQHFEITRQTVSTALVTYDEALAHATATVADERERAARLTLQ